MNSVLKYASSVTLAATMFQGIARADEPNAPAQAFTNQQDKVAYAVGMSLAGDILKRSGVEVNWDIMTEAVKDVMNGRPTKLTEQQMREVLTGYQQELRAKREQERARLTEKNRTEGEEFLASNKSKPGVKTHDAAAPGSTNKVQFQYKVIAEGQGDSPKLNDTIVYGLTGKLVSGKEFESFQDRKVPLMHIPEPGVKEALQLMKPGAKWEIYLPAPLAYGDFGHGAVGPGAAAIFEVELASVEAQQPLTSDIIMVPSADALKAGSNIMVIKPEDLKKMTNQPPPPPKKH